MTMANRLRKLPGSESTTRQLSFSEDLTVRFHEMTFPELRRVARDRCVVLAPIAACEQHSHHLAVYTDTVLCTGVAEGVEQRMADSVLLLPTLWMGASHHHLRFGATLSAHVDLHVSMIAELVEPLVQAGYQ